MEPICKAEISKLTLQMTSAALAPPAATVSAVVAAAVAVEATSAAVAIEAAAAANEMAAEGSSFFRTLSSQKAVATPLFLCPNIF